MTNLHVSGHPLLQHKLTLMRDRHCPTKRFRELLRETGMLLTYEATQKLGLGEVSIETPIGPLEHAPALVERTMVVVPILRAGCIMAEGVLAVMPSARMGLIGVHRQKRDGTFEAIDYVTKLPDPEDRRFLVVDPTIATGVTASKAISILKDFGIDADRITLLGLLACKLGLQKLFSQHPQLTVHLAAIDDDLNASGYIAPGIGDVGDRAFGTG